MPPSILDLTRGRHATTHPITPRHALPRPATPRHASAPCGLLNLITETRKPTSEPWRRFNSTVRPQSGRRWGLIGSIRNEERSEAKDGARRSGAGRSGAGVEVDAAAAAKRSGRVKYTVSVTRALLLSAFSQWFTGLSTTFSFEINGLLLSNRDG